MESMAEMRHAAAVRSALGRAPGPLTMLDPKPLVKVRAVYGRAIATTPTHVLHEWVTAGELHTRWDERWQVHPVTADEWGGEEFG